MQVNERAYGVLLHPVGDLARLARLEIFMLMRLKLSTTLAFEHHYVASWATNTLKLIPPLSGRPPRLLRTAGDY